MTCSCSIPYNLDHMSSREEILKGLYENTLNGRAQPVGELTQEGLGLGMDPMDLLFKALIPSLEEVGRRFEVGEYFVPEMMVSAKAMQTAMRILRPLLAEKGAKPLGKVIMLTVKGDIHDIGKNLCGIMLEGAGFEVVDLGVNIRPDQIVTGVKEHQPQLVGFSAFLTTTMPNFKANIQALVQADLRDKVRIMVGGAPVTQEYSDKVGADGYAKDACGTVRLAKRLMIEMGYEVSMGGEESPPLQASVQAIEEIVSKSEPSR